MKNYRIKTTILLLSTLSLYTCKKEKDDPTPEVKIDTTNAVTFDCNNRVITSAVVWEDKGEGIDYIVNCEIDIQSGGSLTIKPGVSVQFTTGTSGINVSGGYLNATGEKSKPISFKGSNSIKGEWKGIYFFSNNALNILQFANIEDAGSAAWDKNLKPAGVTIASYQGSARASLKNCLVNNNNGYGVYIGDSNENLFEFSNNTIENNSTYPIRLFFDQLSKLDDASNYGSNNGNMYIDLNGNQSVNTSLVIKKLNVPYYLNDFFHYFNFKNTVTFNAGVTMVMEANYLIEVEGTMQVVGTSAEPVTFKGLQNNTKGTWKGMVLRNNNNNSFAFTIFDGGGSSAISYAQKASLCIGETLGSIGKATIIDCTFKNSDGFGYAKKSTATVVDTRSTFSNNTSGNIGSY